MTFTVNGIDKKVELANGQYTFTINANTTVSVTYEAIPVETYTVTFDSNGGTEVASITGLEEGATVALPVAPTKSGYTFAGWFTDDGTFNNPFTAATPVNASITVYAKWTRTVITPETYTVTFIDYDKTVLKTETVSHGDSVTAPVAPEREGYTFTGWDVSFSNVSSDLTVTAQYIEDVVSGYIVRFVDYDGILIKSETVEHGGSATEPGDPAREGYTFDGWDKEFDNITGDLTVTAQYTINSYTVTFVDYDGTTLDTQTVEYGSDATAPAAPTREGYTFTGWDMSFSDVSSDLTITAQYTISQSNQYTVIFDSNGGSEVASITGLEEGATVTLPAAPAKSGYTFAGWYTDNDTFNTPFTVATPVTASITVYAKWTRTSSGGGSSGGGGGGSAEPTIPAGDGSVKVNYTASGGTVTLELPTAKVKDIIKKSKNSEGLLDLSKISGTTTAKFPQKALAAMQKAGLDVTVKLPYSKTTCRHHYPGSAGDCFCCRPDCQRFKCKCGTEAGSNNCSYQRTKESSKE